jgi:hypothetical protein
VQDVNVPFRLMRSAVLAPMMERVPADTFAPNVALSGLAARRSLRIVNVPVEFRERRTGCGSLAPRRLLRIAWTCGTQTLNILRRDRA